MTAQTYDEPEFDESHRHVRLTCAAEIKPRRVKWLWDERLALGTLGLLAGREGLGKSSLGYWLAAQVSRGALAGEYLGQPRAVLVCATEDSWAHTIVPRLQAVDADLTRVFQVEVVSGDGITVGLSLPRDLHQMEESAQTAGAALLLLDPLMSRLSESLDSHKDGEVRRALEPLVAIADRTDMAVLGLIHHNKSGSTDPLQLVMGSKAFTAVARSVHTVVPDPDDDTDTRRLFGTPKNNLGSTALPTLAFSMASHPIETDDGTAWTGKVVWGASSAASIGDAMRRGAQSAEDKTATTEAAEWLDDYLTMNGGSASSADIKRDGAKAGHSQDTLKRAKTKLGLTVQSSGFPRHTDWQFTSGSSAPAQSEQQSEQLPRGESLTALTAPTEGNQHQLVQWEQSAQTGDDHPPTGPATCETCHRPMIITEPGQTTHHPTCDPDR